MKKRKWLGVVIAVVILAAACFVLRFVHPFAPFVLVASLLIQLPIIFGIIMVTFGSAYKDRARERRQQYLKDGDAEVWLRGEETEAKAVQQRYWSRGGKTLAALNRAEATFAAGQAGRATALLAAVDPKLLSGNDRKRHMALLNQLADNLPYEPAFEKSR